MTRIKIDSIAPDPKQPRNAFDETALLELAGSIEESGLIQPIVVRPAPTRKRVGKDTPQYVIVAGERRWRAHKLLADRGLRRFMSIDAYVRKEGSGVDVRVKQIAENLNRANLEPMEEARAFAALRDEFGLTAKEIAKKLGLADFRVEWRLNLLNLSPPIARMVEAGQVDRQLALEASRLPTHRQQTQLVQLVNRGEIAGWGAMRAAADAMLEETTAATLFGEGAPQASAEDAETLTGMERRIERVKAMVTSGWRNGECIIANRVNPNRAIRMAEEIDAIGSALRTMGRELRNVAAQAKIVLKAG